MGYISTMTFAAAGPLPIDSVVSGPVWNVYQDVFISERAIVDVGRIDIAEPVYIENEGSISGNMFLCDICSVKIRNAGEINGRIYVPDGAGLVQVINTQDDITKLKVQALDFSIFVSSATPLNLSDIMKISGNAEKIVLGDSFIILGSAVNIQPLGRTPPEIELAGTVVMEIDDIATLDGERILSNVSGDGIVMVASKNIDPLHVVRTSVDNGGLYASIVRETDYRKFLGDGLGGFLNKLRISDPDNPTLRAMDGAASMSELNDVMGKSVSLNPIKLMAPVAAFENFEMNSAKEMSDSKNINFEATHIFSGAYGLYAVKTSWSARAGDAAASASAYLGAFENNGDLNEFSGMMYGANLYGRYSGKSLWMDASLGFTVSDFKTGMIFDGKNVRRDPTGISIYEAGDAGMKFEIDDDFRVSPFIGIGGRHARVLHQSENDIFVRGGAVAEFSAEAAGIRNDYRISVTAYDAGAYAADIGMKFFSISDMAGGGISYGIINDRNGISHKISATARFDF
jgi:hypothetical protein